MKGGPSKREVGLNFRFRGWQECEGFVERGSETMTLLRRVGGKGRCR